MNRMDRTETTKYNTNEERHTAVGGVLGLVAPAIFISLSAMIMTYDETHHGTDKEEDGCTIWRTKCDG